MAKRDAHERLLLNIASFNKQPFTTTELRNKCSTHQLKPRLCELAKEKKIKHLGFKPAHNSAEYVDIWLELDLKIPEVPAKKEPAPKLKTDLPGWRALCPDLFADQVYPWMPGRYQVERAEM